MSLRQRDLLYLLAPAIGLGLGIGLRNAPVAALNAFAFALNLRTYWRALKEPTA